MRRFLTFTLELTRRTKLQSHHRTTHDGGSSPGSETGASASEMKDAQACSSVYEKQSELSELSELSEDTRTG